MINSVIALLLATGSMVSPGQVPDDCSADVTAALQSSIHNLGDGRTVEIPEGVCYRIDGTLDLTDRHGLTFVGLGEGATLRMVSTPPASPKIQHDMVRVTGGSDITFRNLSLESTNTSPVFVVNREWYSLFNLRGASSVTIDDVRGGGAWGDFVTISPDQRQQIDGTGVGAVLARDITISNSSFDTAGRHAVVCTGCEQVTIDHNIFSNVGYHVFDIEVEGDAWHARNIRMTDNTITGRLHHSIVANAGIGTDVTAVTVSGNVDKAKHETCSPAMWVLDTEPEKTGWRFTGNALRSLGPVLSLEGMADVVVEGNTLRNLRGGCTEDSAGLHVANVAAGSIRFNALPTAARLLQGDATTLVKCGNTIGDRPDRPVAC